MEFSVAANDFQRVLLFPDLLRDFESQSVDARFRFLQGGVPSASLLQDAHCHLIVTPFPPEGSGIMQSKLFQDRIACFYDNEMRQAPKTRKEFLASDFVEVRFPNYSSALSVLTSVEVSELKKAKISVPSFSDLAAFMKGTDLITTQMRTMGIGPLSGFGCSDLPFENDPLTMFMAWHQRDHADPAHRWLREKVRERANVVATNLFRTTVSNPI